MTSQTLETITYKGKVFHEILAEKRAEKKLVGTVYGLSLKHCMSLAAEHCTNFSQAQLFYKNSSVDTQPQQPNTHPYKEWERVYPGEPAPALNKPSKNNLKIDFYGEDKEK